MTALALGPDWLDTTHIVGDLGPVALAVLAGIIFAECGLLLGFFLPGDSLLFTAGLLVAADTDPQLDFPLWVVCVVLFVAAFAGNLVGYGIGRSAGPNLFQRPDSRIFRAEYVARTSEFFERHGGIAIVLARFVPIVRTFITAMAGVARMDFRRFAFFSGIGALLWAGGVTVLGYYLGRIGFIRSNLEPILLIVVLLSVLPIILEFVRKRRSGGQPRTDVPAGVE